MQGFKLSQIQQQRLSLSPSLIQSVKLMSLPLLDLRHQVLEALDANPALELLKDPFVTRQSAEKQDFNDFGSFYDGESEADAYQSFIENITTPEKTLQEHLLMQIGEMPLEVEVEQLARFIIQDLNDDGFLSTDADILKQETNPRIFSSVLRLVQSLDPHGCATKDYKESLVVQAELVAEDYKKQTAEDDAILLLTIDILKHHFECLERGRPDSLISKLQKKNSSYTIQFSEAEMVLEIIRNLNPFPGSGFKQNSQRWIIPDAIVKKNSDGFDVIINDEIIPVLGISPFFKQISKQDALSVQKDKKTKDYATERIKEAQWFMHSLSRRNITLLKVMNSLVEHQKEFFLHGPGNVVPLRMIDLAQELDFHETTISRVANGKYFQCEWGVFEIKYLFSQKVGNTHTKNNLSGQGSNTENLHSRESVKFEMKKIIDESPKKLSDQKIVDQLALKGITISRRTVAKYRSEMNIGSSFER